MAFSNTRSICNVDRLLLRIVRFAFLSVGFLVCCQLFVSGSFSVSDVVFVLSCLDSAQGSGGWGWKSHTGGVNST